MQKSWKPSIVFHLKGKQSGNQLMTETLALLQIINQSVLDTTTRRRLAIIILAMLAMAGRITMYNDPHKLDHEIKYGSSEKVAW